MESEANKDTRYAGRILDFKFLPIQNATSAEGDVEDVRSQHLVINETDKLGDAYFCRPDPPPPVCVRRKVAVTVHAMTTTHQYPEIKGKARLERTSANVVFNVKDLAFG